MNKRDRVASIPESVTRFSGLKREKKAEFLAALAHQLTVVARESYEAGGEGLDNPTMMRSINEIQHRVTGQLRALIREEPGLYPDDVLVKIVLEGSDDYALRQHLLDAFDRAMSSASAAA